MGSFPGQTGISKMITLCLSLQHSTLSLAFSCPRRVFIGPTRCLHESRVVLRGKNRTHRVSSKTTSLLPKTQLYRRERMEIILGRDGDRCVWCQTPITLDSATTDHAVPRIKGGPSWIENELASCRRCNKLRGHVRPLDWMARCQEKGWNPNSEAIHIALQSLSAVIAECGGQRKARPYLAQQERQLKKF
jgi:5-methylcytosine-specific restriction endonuclease McrA